MAASRTLVDALAYAWEVAGGNCDSVIETSVRLDFGRRKSARNPALSNDCRRIPGKTKSPPKRAPTVTAAFLVIRLHSGLTEYPRHRQLERR
jgi:hypothetical protein